MSTVGKGGTFNHTFGFQCPQCLTRTLQNQNCECDHADNKPATHGNCLMREGQTCEASCRLCGWAGTYPSLPEGTPEYMHETAQAWLDMGHLPAEALYLAWLWMDPHDLPMARFSGPNACKVGETYIDLVTVLVRADRLPQGESLVETVQGIVERLETLERREDERSDNRASPPKKARSTG